MKHRASDEPTPWAVICPVHDQVFLTRDEYERQMARPDDRWVCPLCVRLAEWDDENYEKRSAG